MRPKKIVERILNVRVVWLTGGGTTGNLVCKLPTSDHEEWTAWIATIDNDPILGYKRSGLQDYAFGMDMVHAPELSSITIEEKRVA